VKIGVFDSGVGGLSVANAIKEALPNHEVILKQDKEHVPYGSKTTEQVYNFVLPILQSMEGEGCKVIVIACNTVTTNHISKLRQVLDIPLVGIEPMVKPAANVTKTNVIAVCATPLTLSSERYKHLKDTYAQGIKILEPDCSDWSYMIEHNKVDRSVIKERIDKVLDESADVIVLGCTHYHWIEQEITELSLNRATVIQPEQAVIKQLWRVIEQMP
jgi:glutamate racemase